MTTARLRATRLQQRGAAACLLVLGFVSAPAQAQSRAVANGLVLTDATIPELQQAMESGAITSVDLVDAFLARIEAYDQEGPRLNAILQLNPRARGAGRRAGR